MFAHYLVTQAIFKSLMVAKPMVALLSNLTICVNHSAKVILSRTIPL